MEENYIYCVNLYYPYEKHDYHYFIEKLDVKKTEKNYIINGSKRLPINQLDIIQKGVYSWSIDSLSIYTFNINFAKEKLKEYLQGILLEETKEYQNKILRLNLEIPTYSQNCTKEYRDEQMKNIKLSEIKFD